MIEPVETNQITAELSDIEMKPIIESIDSDDDVGLPKERPMRKRKSREKIDKDGISNRRITRSQAKNKIQ